MDDELIRARISALVENERRLRRQVQHGEIDSAQERAQLRNLEESIDRCWDLLRQRRALRRAGQDPDLATARPAGEVEGYLQ